MCVNQQCIPVFHRIFPESHRNFHKLLRDVLHMSCNESTAHRLTVYQDIYFACIWLNDSCYLASELDSRCFHLEELNKHCCGQELVGPHLCTFHVLLADMKRVRGLKLQVKLLVYSFLLFLDWTFDKFCILRPQLYVIVAVCDRTCDSEMISWWPVLRKY